MTGGKDGCVVVAPEPESDRAHLDDDATRRDGINRAFSLVTARRIASRVDALALSSVQLSSVQLASSVRHPTPSET